MCILTKTLLMYFATFEHSIIINSAISNCVLRKFGQSATCCFSAENVRAAVLMGTIETGVKWFVHGRARRQTEFDRCCFLPVLGSIWLCMHLFWEEFSFNRTARSRSLLCPYAVASVMKKRINIVTSSHFCKESTPVCTMEEDVLLQYPNGLSERAMRKTPGTQAIEQIRKY